MKWATDAFYVVLTVFPCHVLIRVAGCLRCRATPYCATRCMSLSELMQRLDLATRRSRLTNAPIRPLPVQREDAKPSFGPHKRLRALAGLPACTHTSSTAKAAQNDESF